MPPLTGRVIAGRYSLQQPIGRGAMGVVWRARDMLLDRDVAVKEVVLSASIGADERKNAYQRTLREARTAARLSHRGVVTIYDVAEEDGRPWIVMELVQSRSLDQVLATEGRLKPLRAGRIGRQLLAALAAAHAAGVLHRDVKPSNVLIATDGSSASGAPDGRDERAVLTDFGIAQFQGDPRLTQTGMVMGSPGFTAPERIRGGDATPASDLWSLGATIYAAVEGRGPYEQRGGAITTMSAIINEDAPIATNAGRLAPLIAALLRREPSARPSAAAAARMFAEVLPLLAGVADASSSAHPATVRSGHVPEPAGPVVSAPAELPDGDPAGARGSAVAGSPAGAEGNLDDSAAASADAVPSADADAPAAAGAPAAAEGSAKAAVAEDVADDAAGAAAGERVAAGGSAAGPADNQIAAGVAAGESAADGDKADDEAAGAEAGTAAPVTAVAATSLDAVPADLVASSQSDATVIDSPSPVVPPVRQPKPMFTSSGRADQARPPFSPSRPAGQVPAQPAPPFSRSTRSADPPTKPQPPYESAHYGGSNAQYGRYGERGGGSNAQHGQSRGQNAQYADPSQPYPDLALQYSPGTAGRSRRPARRGRRGRTIALISAAVVVAAGVGAGVALALNGNSSGSPPPPAASNSASANLPGSVQALDDPSNSIPAGWTQETVQPSATGTTAGFSIATPPGWTEKRSGRSTYFYAPNGAWFMKVDLTPHTSPDMVTEAQYIEKQSAATFPQYKRASLRAVPIRGTNGAFWQFTWVPSGSITTRSDDILFIKKTPAGSQSYAIYFRAPTPGNDWNTKYLPVFKKMLRTFQTVPS